MDVDAVHYIFTREQFLTRIRQAEDLGWARGQTAAVVLILRARGVEVSDEDAKLICSCTDIKLVGHWVRRAAAVETVDDLYLG